MGDGNVAERVGCKRSEYNKIYLETRYIFSGSKMQRVPKDIRAALRDKLRGDDLIEYCKVYPDVCPKSFWGQRMQEEYDIKGDFEDYRLMSLGAKYGIVSKELTEVEYRLAGLAAETTNPEIIDFLLPNRYLLWKAILIPKTYRYIWDHYPDERVDLNIGALALNRTLVKPPYIVAIPADRLVSWFEFLGESPGIQSMLSNHYFEDD